MGRALRDDALGHGPAAVVSILLAALLLAAVALTPSVAYAADAAPALSEARAAIVTDGAGNVLWSRNQYEELPMASITKVMTAMVALDSGRPLDEPCRIRQTELGEDSQTAGFTSEDRPTLRELLQVMLVYSGNDAAVNVAVNVAGSEEAFVRLMNEKAASLGMTRTHFSNPHGLEEAGHHSCAADLALMGRVALSEYPLIASTVRLPSVTVVVGGTPTTFHTTDRMIDRYPGMLGIKTGAVASGTAFLGACERRGAVVFTCVLGCETTEGRFDDTAALLDWAYDSLRSPVVARRGTIVGTRLWADNFAVTCAVSPVQTTTATEWPEGGPLQYSTTLLRDGLLVEDGQVVGFTTWSQDGREAGRVLYQAKISPRRIPSVNTFALPLFGYHA